MSIKKEDILNTKRPEKTFEYRHKEMKVDEKKDCFNAVADNVFNNISRRSRIWGYK